METDDLALRDLRAYCRLVDLGSVTRAAASLGETKGSVSRRLARLERSLGVALVTRSPREVRPTEEGRAYRDRVGHALTLLEEAASVAAGAAAEPAGTVRLTAPPDLGAALLAPVLGVVAERHPRVRVDVVLAEAVLPFAEHGLDLALRVAATLPDSALVAHRLGGTGVQFVAAPAYLAAHGEPRTPADLAAHRVLTYRVGRGRGIRIRRGDAVEEVVMDPCVIASDGALLREAAAAGAGIALLPSLFLRCGAEGARLVPVLAGWEVEADARLYLLHAGGPVLPAAVRAVRDAIRDIVPALLARVS